MINKFIKYCLAILPLVMLSNALAEDDVEQIKPLQIATDVNSVDLLSAKYTPNLPVLSIPAAPNLALHTIQHLDAKIIGNGVAVNAVGMKETYSVTFGGRSSDYFTCYEVGDCQPKDDNGSTLTGTINTSTHIYTQGGSGIKVVYNKQSWHITLPGQTQGGWYASNIIYPDGEVVTFTYDVADAGQFDAHRPVKLSSNIGYDLHIDYQSDVIGNIGWGKVSLAKIVKTSSGVTLAQQTYSGSTTTSLTDWNNRTWQYTGFSNSVEEDDYTNNFTLKLPGDSSNTLVVTSATRSHADTNRNKFVTMDELISTNHNKFVTNVTRTGQSFNYTYTAKSGTGYDPKKQFSKVSISGPGGYSREVGFIVQPIPYSRQFIQTDKDSLGNITTYGYTTGNRLGSVLYPEGNQEIYTYDSLGNITSKRLIDKPTSSLIDIVVTANYDLTNCSILNCFRPNYKIDANGNRTDYTFDANHGEMLTKTEPLADSGERRITTNTYKDYNGLNRLWKTSVCGTSECGTKHEQITIYDYFESTKLPKTITKTNGVGSISQTTTYKYLNSGHLEVEDGPLAGTSDAKYYRYDASGRQTWHIGAINQQGYRVTTKSTYRSQDKQINKLERGVLPNADSTALTIKLTTNNEYNSLGLKTETKLKSASTSEQLTQISYDTLNRPLCSVFRMNPLKFNDLPSSACTLGTEGEFGADRISKNSYDTLSRLTKTISGYGTDDAGIDIEIGYTNNGQIDFRKDGNGNLTDYEYDGFDRLYTTTYPDNSYESNTYYANGNLKKLRKRDGKTLTHNYDAINSKTRTVISGEYTLNFDYDGLGRQTLATRNNSSVGYTYDGLGRLETTTTNGRTLTYSYDGAGRRSKLKHPDNFYVNYAYDTSGALTSIKEYNSKVLVSYGYDNFGRLESISRNNGKTSSLGYNNTGQLNTYDHLNVNNTSFDYNPSSQIINRVVSNADFQIKIPSISQESYEVNNLNQYDSVGTKNISYDNAGNLTSYDSWSYVYNAHNRLTSATKTGSSLALGYDPTGRLESSTLNGSKTNFLYDGQELVGEYNSSGTLINRYVHGIGTDDPLVWYVGSGTTNVKYLLANEQGSIIAETNSSGSITATHQYGPYGEPENTSSSRFRYTGQILLPGTELYYYKARIYHPKLGRFLQTDPIGYDDGMNWYAYVGNDPVNMADPTGQAGVDSFNQWAKGWKDLGNSMKKSASGAKQGAQQLGNATVKAANDTVTAATNPENLKAASSSLGDIAVVATALGQPEIAIPAAIGSTVLGFGAAVQAENPLEAVIIEGVVNHMAKPLGFAAKLGGKNADGFIKDGIEAAGVAAENKYKDLVKQ